MLYFILFYFPLSIKYEIELKVFIINIKKKPNSLLVLFFSHIYKCSNIKMGRNKLEIKKSIQIRFRIEPELRKEFFSYCKKNKTNPSKEMRQFILDKIKKNGAT